MLGVHLAGDPVLKVPVRSRFVLGASCWGHHTVRGGGRGPPGLHQSWKGYIAAIGMPVVSVPIRAANDPSFE